MTDARSEFEFRRLKVPELKHILKGKRIPYTEKRVIFTLAGLNY